MFLRQLRNQSVLRMLSRRRHCSWTKVWGLECLCVEKSCLKLHLPRKKAFRLLPPSLPPLIGNRVGTPGSAFPHCISPLSEAGTAVATRQDQEGAIRGKGRERQTSIFDFDKALPWVLLAGTAPSSHSLLVIFFFSVLTVVIRGPRGLFADDIKSVANAPSIVQCCFINQAYCQRRIRCMTCLLEVGIREMHRIVSNTN